MTSDFVSAVPGSGKTETLINKCYELMENEGVEGVVAITFTDRAAEELMERLKKKAQEKKRQDLIRELPNSNVGTIHNFCSRIVRKYGAEIGIDSYFRVMDELESFNLLEKTVRNYIISVRNEKKVTDEGMILGRLIDEFGTDLEQVIKDCTEIMELHKGYLSFMILTSRGFFTSYSRGIFGEDVLKEVSSRLKISMLPGLVSLLDGIVAQYQNVKRKARLMDFDDLLLYTIRIMDVKGDEIAGKYRFLLVDEFQDTDELQIAIFERFREHGTSFFVVGDPNQSIYSFRGAHPAAQKRFSGQISNQKILRTNRRSGRNLISFFNNFFPSLVEYEKMEGSSDIPGGAYCYIEEDKLLAVGEIIKEKVRNGEKPGNIAILSRTSSDFFNLKRYLKKEGIESVLISGESILKSQEGLDILSIVRWLADPGDQVAQVSILFSPMFDMTVSELMKFKGRYDEILSGKLGKYRESMKLERIDFVLNKILWREGYISRILGLSDGQERVSRITRIMELLSSHVTSYGGDLYGTIEWLKNAKESKESGPIEDLLEDQSRVKIMTIHQAKGLEFNTVIIYDLRPGMDREKYYADEYSGLVVKRDKDFLNSPSKKIIGKSERHNFSLNEEVRILYVAFTRAKNELHLVLGEKDLRDERTARKSDDLFAIFQRTLRLWRESTTQERTEVIGKMGMIPSKVSATGPIENPKFRQVADGALKRGEIELNFQNDEDNENAIFQFLSERNDRVKTVRLSERGSRVTISEGGLRIYEDVPVHNNYFARNGKIEFVL